MGVEYLLVDVVSGRAFDLGKGPWSRLSVMDLLKPEIIIREWKTFSKEEDLETYAHWLVKKIEDFGAVEGFDDCEIVSEYEWERYEMTRRCCYDTRWQLPRSWSFPSG